jgi:hypothetical protein
LPGCEFARHVSAQYFVSIIRIRCAGLRDIKPDFNVGNSILVFELDQKRLRALLDGPTPAEVGTGDMPYLKTNVEMP